MASSAVCSKIQIKMQNRKRNSYINLEEKALNMQENVSFTEYKITGSGWSNLHQHGVVRS